MKFKSKLKSHGTLNGCNRCGYLKSKNFYQNFNQNHQNFY